jgi:hypothetical protein
VNHRPDVPDLQRRIGNGLGQDYNIVFLDHHDAPKGYAVISRGATSPRSSCQTVRHLGAATVRCVERAIHLVARTEASLPLHGHFVLPSVFSQRMSEGFPVIQAEAESR